VATVGLRPRSDTVSLARRSGARDRESSAVASRE